MTAPPLPGFCWTDLYKPLRDALWPVDGGSGDGELSLDEPPDLLKYVECLTPDDAWLNPGSDSDAMDVDPSVTDFNNSTASDEEETDKGGRDGECENLNAEDDVEGLVPNDYEEVDDGPPQLRYINLDTHQVLTLFHLTRELHVRKRTATFLLRHEYTLFMRYAIRLVNKRDPYARFFVTGQPSIGKSFGCYYFLFRLLAMGQPVFFLNSPTQVFYFCSGGVQETDKIPEERPEIKKAISESWVLLDVDEEREWSCPQAFNLARCVIWTSVPRATRMKHFVKYFAAESWYMKPWSAKEIAALTERYAIDHSQILERLHACGPVPRWLFGLGFGPTTARLKRWISEATLDHLFAFKPVDASGDVLCIFVLQPLVVIDTRGQARLQRFEYSAEFLSPYIAQKTMDRAQNKFETIQGQLTAAFRLSETRSVAGKIVEGLMYRALTRSLRQMQLPDVFGAGALAGTLEVIGKAESFFCESGKGIISQRRPLYLRLHSTSFGTVDAIVVTNDKIAFIQTSSVESHMGNFATMLRILARLRRGAHVDVLNSWEVLYCLVGINAEYVHELVVQAKRVLAELKKFDSNRLCEELMMSHNEFVHTRLSKFRVVGFTFDFRQGFQEVVLEDDDASII